MDRTNETLYQTDPRHRYKAGFIRRNNAHEQRMDGKGTHDKTRFYLGSRTISDRNNLKRRIQHRPRHDQHRKTNTTIQTLLHAKTQYLPQSWRFLLGKKEDHQKTTAEN